MKTTQCFTQLKMLWCSVTLGFFPPKGNFVLCHVVWSNWLSGSVTFLYHFFIGVFTGVLLLAIFPSWVALCVMWWQSRSHGKLVFKLKEVCAWALKRQDTLLVSLSTNYYSPGCMQIYTIFSLSGLSASYFNSWAWCTHSAIFFCEVHWIQVKAEWVHSFSLAEDNLNTWVNAAALHWGGAGMGKSLISAASQLYMGL